MNKLSENAAKVAETRYFMDGEDWESCTRRVGSVVAGAENSKTLTYAEKFSEIIYNMDFLPGGRILRNAGRQRGSMYNCVSKGTEVVTMSKGFVKIQDLKRGNKILNGKGEFKTVKNVWVSGHRERLKRIQIKKFGKHNVLDVTDDHKILIYNLSNGIHWKKAGDIDINSDLICLPKIVGENVPHKGLSPFVKVEDVVNIKALYGKNYDVVDGYIKIKNNSNKTKFEHDGRISPLRNIIDLDEFFGELVGFYLAEGTSEGRNNYIVFSFNASEAGYIDRVIWLINKIFGLKASVRENTGNSVQVVANSQILNRFFTKLFGAFSTEKKLPWWWFSLDGNVLMATIKSYLYGDGSFVKTHYSMSYTASSTSKLLIYQLFAAGNILNLYPSFLYKNPKKKSGSINGKDYYNPNWLLYISNSVNNLDLFDNNINNLYTYYPISSIRDIDYNDDVYDLRMDGDPSFVATTAVCHNCYVLPIGDSREEIGQFYKDSLILWGEGGGVGVNISSLRPKGAPIKGVGGHSSGPVSFLLASDAIAETIESGGSRRAAALALMNVTHPDIMEFIDAKLVDGKLPHYNISVGVTDDFLEAVELDEDWEFKFAHQSCGKIKAREIWDKIVNNMVLHAEPGLINLTKLFKNNSYYFEQIQCVNPCLTGDTLVYVADGRRYVDLKTLAKEGKDVPVFCFNDKSKKHEIRMMRRPRVTGSNKKILKIILDDGSFMRCNESHEFYMKDGSIKKAIELTNGDKLHHMVSNVSNKGYMWLFNPLSGSIVEHRLTALYKYGRVLEDNEVVHHKNYNKLDNSLDNLMIMTKEDHDNLHAKDMMAEKNPMVRFPEKNWLIKQDHSGSNNGRYKGFTPKQVFDIAVAYSIDMGRRVTKSEWYLYCKNSELPISKYSLGKYTSYSKMLLAAAKEAGVMINKHPAHIREYKRYLELIKRTDLDLFFEAGTIYVNKICEWCGKPFVVKWVNREVSFCSPKCSSNFVWSDEKRQNDFYDRRDKRQQLIRNAQIEAYNDLKVVLDRDPLRGEWENLCKKRGISHRIRSVNDSNVSEYCFRSYGDLKQAANLNYRVLSVVEDGYEDVYNGTVDGNHNFYIMVGQGVGKNGKIKYNHVLTRNCGEVPLGSYSCCNLGSLVLPNFITGSINTNWKKMEEIIEIVVRFLDDVIDVNKYVLKEIDINAHNSRRIGIGVVGLAEYLFAKKLRYGSEKSVYEIERLMRFIRDKVYEASIKIAVEKGAFPRFDPIEYGRASFVRKLPASLRMDIKKHGVRNVTLQAIAPTGTISLLADVTSGIEPLFRKAYLRRDRVGNRMYVHPLYKEMIIEGEKIEDWYVDTDDLKPEDHFEVQSIIQRYVDGAVSKTINMPIGTTSRELSRLSLEYIRDLKGVTAYIDGSRQGQILNKVTEEEVKVYLKNNKSTNEAGEESVQCATGSCEV